MNTEFKVLRPGNTKYEINKLIAGRWSSRAVDPEKVVDSHILSRILEAGSWAPSAFNNQPWRFITVKKDETQMSNARKALLPGNVWAHNAPVLIFICTLKTYEGRERENPLSGYEAGMAAALMAIQAADSGLVFHQMLGFSKDKVRDDFNIPEEIEILTAVALGYPGNIENVPENRKEFETSERKRKSIEELVLKTD